MSDGSQEGESTMKRSKLWQSVRRLLVLALAAAVLPACGGDKDNGSLCASCGEEGESACGKAFIADEDLHLFCGRASKAECNICFRDDADADGDGVRGEFVCQATLVCAQPQESAARRCYPATPDGKAQPDFTCGGVPPDV